jgi:transglutaminase-like putative cysteine protease
MSSEPTDYLQATPFVDCNDPAIGAFAETAVGNAHSAKEKAIALYAAVRDRIQYDPYVDVMDPAT